MKRILSLLVLVYMASLFVVIPVFVSKNTTDNIEDNTEKVNRIVDDCYIEETETENAETLPDKYEAAINEMQEKIKSIEEIQDKKEWFISYKKIINDYIDTIDPPETIYDYYSEEDIKLICQVVETETYQSDFDSKVNIACVVLNRIEDKNFGNTAKDVITSENQFAYGRKNISEDTILAVEYAFMIEDTTNGALFFHSNETKDTFCGRELIFSDSAGHNFY